MDVRAGLSLYQQVEGLVLLDGGVVLRVLQACVDVWRGGEGADAARQADDAGPPSGDLNGFADALDAQLGEVELLNDDSVFAAQVIDGAGNQGPWAAQATVDV